MIDRSKLGLKEITQEEYAELMKRINRARSPNWSDTGFARILEPLEYESYRNILSNALDTPSVRSVSVRLVGLKDGKKWLKVYCKNIDENVELLLEHATKTKLMYVSFLSPNFDFKLANNEIGFEPTESGLVRSTSIEIPGTERVNYKWDGSDKEYKRIRGIYVQC